MYEKLKKIEKPQPLSEGCDRCPNIDGSSQMQGGAAVFCLLPPPQPAKYWVEDDSTQQYTY